jgi:ribose transport system substrate-binding protein
MKPRRLFGCLMVGLLLASVPACERGQSRTQVAFVTNNPETFWTYAQKGCEKGGKEFGVEVIFRRPNSNDSAVQTRIIDDLVQQDIKALAVSVLSPEGQSKHLKEIADKIPLITQDNDAPDSGRLCYIGTDNYKAGRAVGKLVKEVMPQGGDLALFVGQTDSLNAQQRRQGLLDELADKPTPTDTNHLELSKDGEKYGKYLLHRTYLDQAIGAKAVTNAVDALTELGDKENLCFVGLYAYNPPAILSAAKDKDLLGKLKIVGFDEDEATLQGIIDGHIYGTVVQNPFEFGYRAVRIMAALAKGDRSVLPKDGILHIPHRVITKDGGKERIAAAEFLKEIRGLLAQ